MWEWAAEAVHEAGLFAFGHTDMAPDSVKAGHDGVEHIWGFAQALMTPQELENYQKGEYLHWGLFLKDMPQHGPDDSRGRAARGLPQSDDGL